jgi:hypothetical protein
MQSRVVHNRHTLRILPRPIPRISISRLALRLITILPKRTTHRNVLLLLRRRLHQPFATLLSPAIDEIAVRTVSIAAGELDRSRAGPAFGQDGAEVVADGEAELGHGFHAGWARAVAAGGAGFVACLEGGGVDACGGG